MVFTSHLFLFYFLPAVLAVYFLLPFRWRNSALLLASYIFYGWAEPRYLLLMGALTVVTHTAGRVIGNAVDAGTRRLALTCGVAVCLGTLAYFKYANLGFAGLSALSSALGGPRWKELGILLPVGISFYTFQAMSYCVDVYRGHARPARSLVDYACYVALFPQLVAGPIVRYASVAESLSRRGASVPRFASGVALFILGFAKKILLANPIGSVADAAFGAQSPDAGCAWFGLVAYALQIYYDFCGYSDMAVGLGGMFGFTFLKNFNAPYRATSLTDFWRRWHISLGTFLRDYLYIPLGGNRGGPARTCINLAIVMLLGGLWHGANVTFLVWGAWHGALLIAERWAAGKTTWTWLPPPLRVAATGLFVLGSWVWFRAESPGEALDYFRAMFGGRESPDLSALLAGQMFTPGNLFHVALASLLIWSPCQAHDWSATLTWSRVALLPPLFILALLALFSQASNPFLYFQF